MRVWYVLRQRKIVFRPGNDWFRAATGRHNLPFADRHSAKTTEFGLRSLGRTVPEQRIWAASAVLSGSNRLFPAFGIHDTGERSASFILVCPPRYDDARTGIAGHRRRYRRSPSRTAPGSVRRGGSRARPSTPPPPMNAHKHDWKPMESSTAGARCRNCGTHVTQQFARVFGDNGDVVHGCPSCTTYREMQSGGHLPGD